MKKTERRLTFEFVGAFAVDQPEEKAQPLKCVDFAADWHDETWMIEVTEAERASEPERKTAIAQLAGQFKNGYVLKDSLMKLYGTHAHMSLAGVRPCRKLFFALILGLPEKSADTHQRRLLRDKMQRVTNEIGPSFLGTANPLIVRVESLLSWNASIPKIRIS